MSKHKSMFSFFISGWHIWFPIMLIISFIWSSWVEPDMSFFKSLSSMALGYCIYRFFEVLEELWERTEEIKKHLES